MEKKQRMVQIEEQTLVNLLRRFVENAPDSRSESKTVNPADPTHLEKKWCYVYLPDLEWLPNLDVNRIPDESDFPQERRYKLTLTFCWGVEIEVMYLPEVYEGPVGTLYNGYYDDGWHWCHNKDWDKERIAEFMKDLIVKILESGSYKKHEEYDEDYPCQY